MSEERNQSLARLLAGARRDPRAFIRDTRARAAAGAVAVAMDWEASYDQDLNWVYIDYAITSLQPNAPLVLVVPAIEYADSGDPFGAGFQCITNEVDNQELEGLLIANRWAPLGAGRPIRVGIFGYVDRGGELVAFSVERTLQA